MVSLYFHIPFCSKKCPYCHFYVLPDQEPLKELLLEGLQLEWKQKHPLLAGKTIESIYFGGGTPTLLGAKGIETILKWIDAPPFEITIEANPEHCSSSLMREFFHLGINRVSLGVQSLDRASLNMLGRGHGAQDAVDAIEVTHQAGIENISIDLMYDLPEQTFASWQRTIDAVASLPIRHLSLYNLTFEPRTLFFKRKETLLRSVPSPDASLEMLQYAIDALEAMGLKRYEISAFAKEDYRSHHNIGYWTARPFLGYGPSAFSYFDKSRFSNIAHLKKYTERLRQNESPIDFSETLEFPNDLHELLAIRLRLFDPIDLSAFQKEHGHFPSETWMTLKDLEARGWLRCSNDTIQLSKEGLLFYDSVAEAII
jgi:oxygen-independent coproporphyrinogen III oxidase